jgi:hypothetical protein
VIVEHLAETADFVRTAGESMHQEHAGAAAVAE